MNDSETLIERLVSLATTHERERQALLPTTTSPATFNYGGMEHFRNYLQLFLPYTFFSSLGFLVGICGKLYALS